MVCIISTAAFWLAVLLNAAITLMQNCLFYFSFKIIKNHQPFPMKYWTRYKNIVVSKVNSALKYVIYENWIICTSNGDHIWTWMHALLFMGMGKFTVDSFYVDFQHLFKKVMWLNRSQRSKEYELKLSHILRETQLFRTKKQVIVQLIFLLKRLRALKKRKNINDFIAIHRKDKMDTDALSWWLIGLYASLLTGLLLSVMLNIW